MLRTLPILLLLHAKRVPPLLPVARRLGLTAVLADTRAAREEHDEVPALIADAHVVVRVWRYRALRDEGKFGEDGGVPLNNVFL